MCKSCDNQVRQHYIYIYPRLQISILYLIKKTVEKSSRSRHCPNECLGQDTCCTALDSKRLSFPPEHNRALAFSMGYAGQVVVAIL